MLNILIPENTGFLKIAADEFCSLYEKVTGDTPRIITRPETDGDMVVLGSDAVNPYALEKILDGTIPQFSVKTGTDEYQLRSVEENGRTILFIAGGRRRSLLYAVYDFFERRAECRYFWDGDVIPSRKEISIKDLDVTERPRFEYRGLRYFAHRSLKRFQAEHWDFEDWKREIDWVLKKRLNLFMLRIGMDDLFQLAFPDIVKYPGWKQPESIARSYNDRDLFWSLRYRGELRKKILEYARERDLLHPEDIGTMTHWYSRTPKAFLEQVKPDFVPQATRSYGEETGLVWDIRQDKHLDNYFKLTEAHIANYGSPDIFHTIGLAERMCYKDRDRNLQMKLYSYRRIIEWLRRKYPFAPLLIASWDFSMYWTPEEVRELLNEFDPANTIIFDYTADTSDELNNFTNWGVVGKFPWIFGIFHEYEPGSEVRGNYDVIERRLPIAAADPMCKGLVFWPEASHTDTLMLEYMAANAWNPVNEKIIPFLAEFCRKRYARQCPEMTAIWQKVFPLAMLNGFHGPQSPRRENFSEFSVFNIFMSDIYTKFSPENLEFHRCCLAKMENALPTASEAFALLSGFDPANSDEFIRRDLIDLARTVAGRLIAYGFSRLALLLNDWSNGAADENAIQILAEAIEELFVLTAELLAAHEDYSLYESLLDLQSKHECNPDFETTLKGNAENDYCRSYIYELFTGVYIPSNKAYFQWVRKKIATGDRSPWNDWEKRAQTHQEIVDKFYATPLAELAPDRSRAFLELPATLAKLAGTAEKITRKY
ncbi:MAG: alpha-N-acetylglucosaminidase TIM-barrel domain-containing protein [Victivallaceae bacterium]